MLRGNWCFGLAFAGLILACADHANAESQDQHPDTQNAVAKSLNEIAATYRQEAERAQRPDKQTEPCERGDDRRYSDLCAQWKAADAAADSAWWAWAGGVLGILSLVGVFIALGLAFHSNWIARDTAKRQLRAYMGINKYDLTPYEIGVVGTGRFMVAMQNFGQTPAIALTTQVSYAITEWVDRDTRPEAWDFESDRFPIDVAPGAPMFREIYFSEHAAAHLVELQTGASALWVKFHAVYEDIFGRRHEQTTLFYSRRSSYLSGDMLPIDQTREITTGP